MYSHGSNRKYGAAISSGAGSNKMCGATEQSAIEQAAAVAMGEHNGEEMGKKQMWLSGVKIQHHLRKQCPCFYCCKLSFMYIKMRLQ